MLSRYRGIILLASGFVLMNLVGLDRSSVVWIDEVTLNDPAKELAFHGVLRSSVFDGSDGSDRAYFWQPPAFPLVTALVYRIFGFGIWQTRVPVVLFGGCAVAALYFVALLLLNSPRAALFSATIFALNPQFIHTSRSGRMDALCLFLAFLGLIIYLKSASGRKFTLVAAGLCIGLSILTHPIGVVWAIAVGALLLLLNEDNRAGRIALFGVGVALPVSGWLLYALQAPEYFQQQFLSHVWNHAAQGSVFTRFYEEFAFYGGIYRSLPFVLVGFVGSLVWFMWKYHERPVAKTQVLVLFGLPFLFDTLFMLKSGGSGFTILHPIAMISIVLGAGMSAMFPARINFPGRGPERIALMAVSLVACNLLVAGILGRYLTLAYQWDERDYRTVEDPILAHVSAGSKIWGAPQVWYAAVKAGASLRVRGDPNPHIDDFAVTRLSDGIASLPGFHKIAAIGKPFPPVFGRFAFSPADYQLVMWESDRRATKVIQ